MSMENYLEINYEKNMQMLSEAVKYCEKNFLHEDIINTLYTDNDLKKQLCLIELKEIKSQEDANVLVRNLTGHSGPVRETASYKILDLIQQEKYNIFFQEKNILNTFIKAITDINPSVSRNTVEILKYVIDKQYIYIGIIQEINNTLTELQNIKQNRSYVANKKNFNLYWNLEALSSIADIVSAGEELVEILNKTANSNDYTIREKTAKVAIIYSQFKPELNKFVDILKNDDNFYVKNSININ